MAGYMYLGSQRVCPAVLMGGSEEFIFPANIEGNKYLGVGDVDFKLPDDVEELGQYSLNMAFGATNSFGVEWLKSIDLNNVKTIKEAGACYAIAPECSNITSFYANKLESIDSVNCFNAAFRSCGNLTTAEFKNLKSISGNYVFWNAFARCPKLENVNFENLETIGKEGSSDYMAFRQTFTNDKLLTSVSFRNLSKIYQSGAFYGAFSGTENLNIYYNSLKETSFVNYNAGKCFENLFSSGTGCVVHFPSNLSTYITTSMITTILSGSTNCSVLFDLPATE